MSSLSQPLTPAEREEELRKLGEQAIRMGEKTLDERDSLITVLEDILKATDDPLWAQGLQLPAALNRAREALATIRNPSNMKGSIGELSWPKHPDGHDRSGRSL